MARKIDPNGKPQARRKTVLAAGGAAVVVGAMAAGVLSGAEPIATRGEAVATRPTWQEGKGGEKVLQGGVEARLKGDVATTEPVWKEKPATTGPATQGGGK